MISKRFSYADNVALLHSSGNWKNLEGTLSQDMSTLSAFLQTWRLKLSHTKTVTTTEKLHSNNQEAKRELKVYNNNKLLSFCPTPTYLGVKLDRLLTIRHHLVALRKKLSSCVTLLITVYVKKLYIFFSLTNKIHHKAKHFKAIYQLNFIKLTFLKNLKSKKTNVSYQTVRSVPRNVGSVLKML